MVKHEQGGNGMMCGLSRRGREAGGHSGRFACKLDKVVGSGCRTANPETTGSPFGCLHIGRDFRTCHGHRVVVCKHTHTKETLVTRSSWLVYRDLWVCVFMAFMVVPLA